MLWNELFDKNNRPDIGSVEAFIRNTAWSRFTNSLEEIYSVEPKIEHSICSMPPGWNIKYKKAGKSLCTLYPMDGYFMALVVIGNKEMAEALITSCSEYVRNVFDKTQPGQGQNGL